MSVGLLDTSVIIDWDDPSVVDALPDESAISAITFAELSAGPSLSADVLEGLRRQIRLQQVEASFEPIPFDVAAARSYGLIVGAVNKLGRNHRSRVADLMIAATAYANGMALYTRNPGDFAGLEDLVTVVTV